MKNSIIPSNKNGGDNKKSIVGKKIQYFRQLIQKSLLSAQKYKQQDVIGANELNQCVQTLERIYLDIVNINMLLDDKAKMTTINEEWLNDIKYIEFLRDYGSKFSINRMLGFDSVKSRLSRQQELTFLEFNYMIMQGYDFLQLSRKYDCRLQIGGSDQWGNIINGIDLTKKCESKEIFGLTTPLLTNNDGKANIIAK